MTEDWLWALIRRAVETFPIDRVRKDRLLKKLLRERKRKDR